MHRERGKIPSFSQRSFLPSVILFKTIFIGSRFTNFIVFLFSFSFHNILVVLYHFWHNLAISHSFFFFILLLLAIILRLQPANMTLDGSFDVALYISDESVQNSHQAKQRGLILRLLILVCSFSWMLFSVRIQTTLTFQNYSTSICPLLVVYKVPSSGRKQCKRTDGDKIDVRDKREVC